LNFLGKFLKEICVILASFRSEGTGGEKTMAEGDEQQKRAAGVIPAD
jgi:hypothetical protein